MTKLQYISLKKSYLKIINNLLLLDIFNLYLIIRSENKY